MHVILYRMTEIELTGTVLPATSSSADDDLLKRLTQAWLERYDSPHTFRAYESDLRHWLGWCHAAGLHPLGRTPADTDMWITAQRDQGAARRTIARRLSAIASWYSYLILNAPGLVPRNPADGARRPNVDRDHSPTVGLTRQEADRLIHAAYQDGPRSAAIIRLLLTNAYRCGVICTAFIEDLSYDRGHRVLTVRVKGGHLRRDPIPPPTSHAIDAYLAGRGNPESGPLFATKTGRHLTEPYLWHLVRRLARNAGLDAAAKLNPHSLRHTAITEALDATHDLRKAQDLAGHADPRTTRLYDLRRGQLDGHAAYVLATRYGTGSHDE